MERRSSHRTPVNLMVNTYLDGYPYACKAVDLSQSGMLMEPIAEPSHAREAFPIEIGMPGMADSIWIWARKVGSRGRAHAVRFVAVDAFDRILLDRIIEDAASQRA
jgi:hypothetical protein